VVDATLLALEKSEANFESFNIGTGVCTNVIAIANTLKKLYKTNIEITISGNYRLGDIRDNFADITKAKTLLGFEPKWNFEDGISQFVNWVNKQEIKEDKYEISINEMKEKGLYK
jgi:dTDP-L-rhamnose 4-epimerase